MKYAHLISVTLSDQPPNRMKKDRRPWTTNLELNKKSLMTSIGFLMAGLLMIGLFLIISSDIRICFILPGLTLSITGVITSLIYLYETQRIKRSGICLIREVSRTPILHEGGGSIKNSSEFMEYRLVDEHFRLFIPRDIITVRELIKELLSERGVSYRMVEVEQGTGKNTLPFNKSRQLLKFNLPENIEIGIHRGTIGGKLNPAVTIYVSIFPFTYKNEGIVETWRERIEIKLRDFKSPRKSNSSRFY